MADKKIQVVQNVRPRILTCRGTPGKERKHVDIDRVNSVKNILSAPAFLITVCQLADGNRDANVREIQLRIEHLSSESLRSDDVVEKRLSPDLDDACDELALGVVMKDGGQGVETRLEGVAIGKTTPGKSMNAESVVPGSGDNVIIEAWGFAITVKANVTTVESISDVGEILLQLGQTLTRGNFVAETQEGILVGRIAPPSIRVGWHLTWHFKA